MIPVLSVPVDFFVAAGGVAMGLIVLSPARPGALRRQLLAAVAVAAWAAVWTAATLGVARAPQLQAWLALRGAGPAVATAVLATSSAALVAVGVAVTGRGRQPAINTSAATAVVVWTLALIGPGLVGPHVSDPAPIALLALVAALAAGLASLVGRAVR